MSLIHDLRFSLYTCVLNLHKARHSCRLTQASTKLQAKQQIENMCVHPSRTNLKLLPHCCPPFASSSTWPGATASQGFWGGEVAMTSNIFRPQLKRNHQSGLSNQIFIKKIGDKVQNGLLTLWGISWVERTSKTIGKIGTGSKSFEALIKALYLQTLELPKWTDYGGTTSYFWIPSSGIDQQWRHWTFFHSRYSLLKWFGTFKLSIRELCTFRQERSFARWQQYWSSQLVGVPNWETSGGLTISFNILSDHFPPLYGIICNAPKFGRIISF